MKKLVLALSILTIAFAGMANAQNVFVDDSIGIFTADGANSATAGLIEPVTLHVLITGMTAPTVSAFEFKLSYDGPLVILPATFSDDAINAATREGEFAVGFGTPQPAVDGQVELMTFDVFSTGDGVPCSLFIGPTYFSTLDGVPSYVDNNENAQLVEMRPSTGGFDVPVFVLNGEAPVATESTTLDALKTLYR